MGIGHYIKEIGRGPRGAKPLTREQAADLFGQVLDGTVSDLEIGAFCLAMRIKSETPEELAGFVDATQARLALFAASSRPLVVLPSYNGARKLPVLTPLLALLLAREGLPVLLHGMCTEARRVLASEVLQALDVAALTEPQVIEPGHVAHIDTGNLHPGMARLLAARQVIGLRNPGHSVAKLINPCAGPALVVTSYTHPEYLDRLCATFGLLQAHALLSRGLEGEVAADPRRWPRYDGFVQGQHQLLEEQQAGTVNEVQGLPTEIDAISTAHYTRQVLQGHLPVPLGLQRQVEHILHLVTQIEATARVL